MDTTTITDDMARDVANNLGVDFSNEKFTVKDLRNGIITEFEHKDVIGDDINKSAKIALSHLRERGDYYDGLEYIENAPWMFWRYAGYLSILILIAIVILLYLYYNCVTTANDVPAIEYQ